jgi:hypothetical protein
MMQPQTLTKDPSYTNDVPNSNTMCGGRTGGCDVNLLHGIAQLYLLDSLIPLAYRPSEPICFIRPTHV